MCEFNEIHRNKSAVSHGEIDEEFLCNLFVPRKHIHGDDVVENVNCE